jgi:hypothetical protein
MTNTLHRRGTEESLKQDYVIFCRSTKGINNEGSAEKYRKFTRICLKHHPVNLGDNKQGNILQPDIDVETMIANMKDGAPATAVFDNIEALQAVIEELIQADMGLSINVSGLFDEVQQCCHRAGIERHSVEHSLGIWGAKDLLYDRQTLELNTMCGHGMVSFNLIRKMIEYVKLRRLTPEKAAQVMARCCECGAFNPTRAKLLLEKVLSQA